MLLDAFALVDKSSIVKSNSGLKKKFSNCSKDVPTEKPISSVS